MDERFQEGTFCLPEDCVPIMLEAFSRGTRFAATTPQWEGNGTICFTGRHYWDRFTKIHYIRVSNDERRKLIPILKKLQNKNRSSQK
jgi:hypothetical protein